MLAGAPDVKAGALLDGPGVGVGVLPPPPLLHAARRRRGRAGARRIALILCSAKRPPTASVPAVSVLPDVHALLGREVELVARLDPERLVPFFHVPPDPVDAEFLGAVRVVE